MSRKKRQLNQNKIITPPILKANTLDDIELLQQKLEIEKHLMIEKGLSSNDPYTLLTTQKYLEQHKKEDDSFIKSFLVDPDISSLNTNNYKISTKVVSFETLRRMARTPIIKTIIGTRVDQVAGFAEPSNDDQEKGWKIRKKKSLFNKEKQITKEEEKKIAYITKFVQEGGKSENKWDFDSIEEYIRSLTLDSLTFDQMCMECANNQAGKLVQFYPVDGATVRLVDQSNPEFIQKNYQKINGYFPKYVQVWREQVFTAYYPWEMTFGVRNKTTDISTNGYGISELEDMVSIVTWLLFGMQYNGNFFSQGSNPKGFFTVKGKMAPNTISDFKQMWRNTITGVQNSHKVPVIGGEDVNWVNMQTSNKDMEFNQWLEFLIVIGCSTFKIDPTECGFNLQKGSTVFGQDGQKERLKHSQSKGLIPILKLIQRIFTKYVVERLDDDYEFVFTGIEIEDQKLAVDIDKAKIEAGVMSLEDGFKKYSGREFNPEKDTILNSVYTQQMQMKQFGGDFGSDSQGSMDEDFDNKQEENPFQKALTDYINKQ